MGREANFLCRPVHRPRLIVAMATCRARLVRGDDDTAHARCPWCCRDDNFDGREPGPSPRELSVSRRPDDVLNC
jgi:hypothetical protein